MKKWFIGLGFLLGLVGGYLGLAHFSGGAFPTLGLPIGGQEAVLRERALSFWEDMQFKDYERGATYHAPDRQELVDIPFLLWRLFAVKPELLDIMEFEILFVEVDSTGDRARLRTWIKFEDLIKNKIRERDVMLYFHRAGPEAPWYMELEDSLRRIDGDENKEF